MPMMMPFQILGIWLRGLLSLALIGVAIYLLREWYDSPRPVVVDAQPAAGAIREPAPGGDGARRDAVAGGGEVRVSRWHLGFDRRTAYLIGGVLLLLTALGGGSLGYPLLRKSEGKSATAGDPARTAPRGTVHRVRLADGSELHTESLGPEDGLTIIMTHGWGVDSSEWDYSRARLAERNRLIFWDLPGLGQSQRPANNDYSLENLARDLDAVVGLAGGKPVVLLGHSIGGMINLTYCRLFPEAIGTRISGVVQVHTTYTNPVKTTKHAAIYTALQKPLLETLCHLMIWLAPVVWVMNLLSYLNGSVHQSTEKSSFAGTESREQLDKTARYMLKAWPGVIARGMLGMFRYDATATLGTIGVPALVVTGDRDDTTQPWASGVMAESIPKAVLHTLTPARHMGHMEHHDDFASTVNSFVASLGDRTAAGVTRVEGLTV